VNGFKKDYIDLENLIEDNKVKQLYAILRGEV
jgi:hypothetical protein